MNTVSSLEEFDRLCRDGVFSSRTEFVFNVPFRHLSDSFSEHQLRGFDERVIQFSYSWDMANHLSHQGQNHLPATCCGSNRRILGLAFGVRIGRDDNRDIVMLECYFAYRYLAQLFNGPVWIPPLSGDWPVPERVFAPQSQAPGLWLRVFFFIVRSLYVFFETGGGPVLEARKALSTARSHSWGMSDPGVPCVDEDKQLIAALQAVTRQCESGRRLFAVADEMGESDDLCKHGISADRLKHELVFQGCPQYWTGYGF